MTFARKSTTFYLYAEHRSFKKQKSPLYHYQKKTLSIKRTEEVDYSSNTSSDEDFIENSLMHMSIKAVSEPSEEKKKGSLRELQLYRERLADLRMN